MYINQEHLTDCAPVAIFNAVRHFDPNAPYYIFNDIKRNLKTGQRNTDYGFNFYTTGTHYHKEYLVIKELEMLGFWKIVKYEVANKKTPFCNKMKNRMLKALSGKRIAIIRGDADTSNIRVPYDPPEIKKEREANSKREVGEGRIDNHVHSFLVPTISNQEAHCVNFFPGELITKIPVKNLMVNGYWVLRTAK